LGSKKGKIKRSTEHTSDITRKKYMGYEICRKYYGGKERENY
jgi:hypothetical protein